MDSECEDVALDLEKKDLMSNLRPPSSAGCAMYLCARFTLPFQSPVLTLPIRYKVQYKRSLSGPIEFNTLTIQSNRAQMRRLRDVPLRPVGLVYFPISHGRSSFLSRFARLVYFTLLFRPSDLVTLPLRPFDLVESSSDLVYSLISECGIHRTCHFRVRYRPGTAKSTIS